MTNVALTRCPCERSVATIGRRVLLGGSALAPFAMVRAAVPVPSLPVPPGDRLGFRIMRKGSNIGDHTVTFTRSGETLTVAVATDMVVSAGAIATFRYRQRATVRWQGGQIVSIDADTNNDGIPQRMAARHSEGGLVVEGSNAVRYTAPPRAQAGTFWNRAMLDGPFISMDDGRLMCPTVTLIGVERVDVAGGSVEARLYTLRGDVNLDTFYDLTAIWAGLRFTGKDGSEIRYLRA